MRITSLPFVHTARRPYRLSDSVNHSEIDLFRTSLSRFSERRNKDSGGEPAEGSLTHSKCHACARSVVATYMTFRRLRAWEVDLLIMVSKLACHFLDNNFHHLNLFHFR